MELVINQLHSVSVNFNTCKLFVFR